MNSGLRLLGYLILAVIILTTSFGAIGAGAGGF
jgi:hypothetical protein